MIQNIIVYVILAVSVLYVIYKVFIKRKKKGSNDCDSCETGDCSKDLSGCDECPLKSDCKKISDTV